MTIHVLYTVLARFETVNFKYCRIKITHDKRYRLPTIPGKDKIFLQVYFAIFFENLLIQRDKYNKNMSSKFSYNTFLFSFLNVPRYIAWLLFQLSLFLCNMCSEHLHNWAAYDLLSARTQYPRASTNIYVMVSFRAIQFFAQKKSTFLYFIRIKICVKIEVIT